MGEAVDLIKSIFDSEARVERYPFITGHLPLPHSDSPPPKNNVTDICVGYGYGLYLGLKYRIRDRVIRGRNRVMS